MAATEVEVWRGHRRVRLKWYGAASAASAWPVLSHRLWSVLDADKLGAISFRHVVTVLGILCSGDVTAKLKLLFCLHLPGVVLPGELEDKGGSCDSVML